MRSENEIREKIRVLKEDKSAALRSANWNMRRFRVLKAQNHLTVAQAADIAIKQLEWVLSDDSP